MRMISILINNDKYTATPTRRSNSSTLYTMSNKWMVSLNNKDAIPAFGLGTWQSKKGEVGKAVDIAIRAGYRHIDGAYMYMNEDEIGEALQNLYKEGIVKREDIFITSKLSSFHMQSKEDVLECFQTVLKNLQTDYLDLFLIHGPLGVKKGAPFPNLREGDIIDYDEERTAVVWKTMEELVAKGSVKAIGISNFTITKTDKLLKTAKIVPAVNQVECHPYFQQVKLRTYCKSKGIAIECYAPLGSPSRFGIDPNDPVVMEDPVINEIATKYNVTAAQICISFLLHLGLIVIPKSVSESRILENLKATEITLTQEEIDRLKAIDKNLRYFSMKRFLPPNSSITVETVWDIVEDEEYNI